MTTIIIDYGMSNLGSIRRSLEECGAKAIVSDNPDDLESADKILLPGVGSFSDGMGNISRRGWINAIKKSVIDNKTPILGICLGMQLFASFGTEGGEIEGLNLIQGKIEKLVPENNDEKIPHIGWNEIIKHTDNHILEGIESGCDFYFVHSFHFNAQNKQDIVATTPYCGEFVSVLAKENIFGVQFHPEKSQDAGFKVLKNFLEI